MEHDLDREEFETIPWSQLAPPRVPTLTRVMVAAAGVLGVAVIGVLGARMLRGGPARVTVTLPPEVVATSPRENVAADPAPVVADSPSAISTAEERLYSEADLMAVMPEEDQRAAAARAEWFVTDFFTVDGDSATASAVREALPEGFDAVLPHDVGGGVSYVEWARAMRVAPDGPGRYVVTVAFRVLSSREYESLIRDPVQAVHVRVAVDGESSTAVVDLPEPAIVETAVIATPVPPDAEPPPEVVATAFELAGTLGADAAVEQAGVDESGWRIVVSVASPSGLRWPLVVRPQG
jgi:hypothetical protein